MGWRYTQIMILAFSPKVSHVTLISLSPSFCLPLSLSVFLSLYLPSLFLSPLSLCLLLSFPLPPFSVSPSPSMSLYPPLCLPPHSVPLCPPSLLSVSLSPPSFPLFPCLSLSLSLSVSLPLSPSTVNSSG